MLMVVIRMEKIIESQKGIPFNELAEFKCGLYLGDVITHIGGNSCAIVPGLGVSLKKRHGFLLNMHCLHFLLMLSQLK